MNSPNVVHILFYHMNPSQSPVHHHKERKKKRINKELTTAFLTSPLTSTPSITFRFEVVEGVANLLALGVGVFSLLVSIDTSWGVEGETSDTLSGEETMCSVPGVRGDLGVPFKGVFIFPGERGDLLLEPGVSTLKVFAWVSDFFGDSALTSFFPMTLLPNPPFLAPPLNPNASCSLII